MTPTATPDTTVLERLDFTPDLPCEAKSGCARTSHSADYLARIACPHCGFGAVKGYCREWWDNPADPFCADSCREDLEQGKDIWIVEVLR